MPAQGFIARHVQQRLEQRRNLAVDEMLQAAAHFVGHVRPGFVIDKSVTCGRMGSSPLTSLPTAVSPHISPPCSVKSNSGSAAL
jgi:hypothetical protein